MRKLVTSFLMTINGVIGNPHEWAAEFDKEAAEVALDQLRKSHAMLMGRRTYEIFSELWPGSTGEYPHAINAIKKYVFSNTLDEAGWNNVTIVNGDPAQEVAKLKQEREGDLVLYGHGMLGRTLLQHGLVDEMKVWVFPRFVGGGTLIFSEGENALMEHVDTAILANGIAVLTYRPKRSS
ncbi:MAG TPA: dihydrofolate reductase family protein [Gaiellaceae bacterium]|nr:dihydrofolate reductase family protein [Gaiellaceae bacterium]